MSSKETAQNDLNLVLFGTKYLVLSNKLHCLSQIVPGAMHTKHCQFLLLVLNFLICKIMELD